MCTGIIHVYRCCRCNAVIYKLKEAAKGYTCRQARSNCQRGICKKGIEWSHYDRTSDENCLFCEIYLGGETSELTANNCDEGGEPWAEDREDDVGGGTPVYEEEYPDDSPSIYLEAKTEDNIEDYGKGDDDNEEGGAKI
ncbi:hypothetical protein ANO14919_038250 [Xylariales sp. No.14919]|nr:hypothetical protein F5X98DRAFT_274915 [Xylaria grammica]GAW14423.1 hypothetical protein ANO14919_038250 [Xylariales sp. No.14919]